MDWGLCVPQTRVVYVCVRVAVNMQDLANTSGPAIILCTLYLRSVYHWTVEALVQTIASFTGAPTPEQAVPVNILPPVPLCR